MNNLTIVVPFYNEQSTLLDAVENLINEGIADEIILVNDCSTDNSKIIADQIANNYEFVTIINNNKNQGKGYSIIQALNKTKTKYFGIFDADLEYFAQDVKKIYKVIIEKKLDFVIGSRFFGEERRKNLYLRTYLGNKFLSYLFSIVYRNSFSDIATCLKLFKVELIQDEIFIEKGFEIEVELLSKLQKNSKNYLEVPIRYHGRSYREGKKIRFQNGIKYIIAIFKYK